MDADTRSEIEAHYNRLVTSTQNLDAAGIISHYAPTARFRDTRGSEHSLATEKSQLKSVLNNLSSLDIRMSVDKLKVKGSKAIAEVTSRWTGLYSPPGAQTKRLRVEGIGRDTWVKTSSGWRIWLSESLREQTWLDGVLAEDRAVAMKLPPTQQSALVAELKSAVISFKTVQAGNGLEDLEPLRRMIGDARIVALGEASHGTAQFFKMKHRLLEFLVNKMGFTVFAIEANWPESQAADRYIKTGQGDAASALGSMYFWTWATEEVRDMIEWMRDYNQAPGNHPILSFSSFDMQFHKVAAKRVKEFAAKLEPDDKAEVEKQYKELSLLDAAPAGSAGRTDPRLARLRNSTAAVVRLLDAKRDAILKTCGPDELRDARQCARIVEQACDMRFESIHPARDRFMADNVKWLADTAYPGQKIVLWAHNGHVSGAGYAGVKSMGMYLRDMFAKQLFVVGFASDHGQIRAIRMKGGKFVPGGPVALTLPPAQEDSVEALFRRAGLPRFILDLHAPAPDSRLGKWLANRHPHRGPGAAYDPDNDSQQYAPTSLSASYDAIVFIAQSTPARGLPARKKQTN